MVGFELHSFVAKVFQEQITSCIPWKKFNHELNFTTLLRLHCIWDKVQRIQFQTIFLSFKRRFWYNKVIPDQSEFIQIGAQTNLFWRTANDFKNIFYVIFENQFWNQDVFSSFFYLCMVVYRGIHTVLNLTKNCVFCHVCIHYTCLFLYEVTICKSFLRAKKNCTTPIVFFLPLHICALHPTVLAKGMIIDSW